MSSSSIITCMQLSYELCLYHQYTQRVTSVYRVLNASLPGCTMFSVTQSSKSEFLDKARQAREDRKGQKDKENSATHIQALVRRFLCRCRLQRQIR
ncbi:Ubiquitin-protein ligase E3B [Liparis tanakae]|uniref:Ubiquitin-protein ligase E3B n=1 Tax=Liparis tanakae TaxID=230148 RepID=A0A4Z2EFT8_9TELE|nr:Ubiquitin-protein ligase E3B [Liparis tanakae]